MASLFTNFRRIIRSGFTSFWRNGLVTIASILVMTTTLFVLGTFIFVGAMLDETLAQVRQKVDVNVYFTPEASEADILGLQSKLEDLPEVREVVYLSRDEVLQRFEERHANDELILGALEELGDNPLGAVLNVQANETSQYEQIANFLQSDESLGSDGSEIIMFVNYFRNKEAINKLTDIINTIDVMSVAVLIFFAFISILITFNTVRLAIYNSRDEISVMKLVGASNTYVRGPFVIEGIMYGVVSALIALVLFYPLSLWVGPFTETFFGATNMFDYYVDNFANFFLLLVVTGMVLGAVSSFLAVKKYLKA